MPTFEGETIRPLSLGGKSLVGIEPIALDREAAPLTARPSLLSPKGRAKIRLSILFKYRRPIRTLHKRKQTARNEVKPLKLKCRCLSFHKCLACNQLSDLPSLHPIYIRKQVKLCLCMHITAPRSSRKD